MPISATFLPPAENRLDFKKYRGRRFKLSLSLGITQYSPESSSCSVDELLSRADSQMYAQKKKRYSP